jgi:hypothetical protein
MRLRFDRRDGRQIAEVTLSTRNLLALLHKAEHFPGSARRIETDDCPAGWRLAVCSESDAEHYARRPAPPGPMHPATELFIAAAADATAGEATAEDGPDADGGGEA